MGGERLLAVFDREMLTEFEIPVFVTRIADRVFDNCYYLTKITGEEGNEAFFSVNGVL